MHVLNSYTTRIYACLKPLLLLITLLITPFFALAQDETTSLVNDQLKVEIIQHDAGFPLSLEIAPDGRLFYVSRGQGAIMVNDLAYDNAGRFGLSNVVLDGLPTPIGQGDGVLSMALDPHFADNHYFYVYYTKIDDEQKTQQVIIARYTEVDGTAIDETIIVDDLPTNPTQRFHFGGALSFGPDGKLYIMYGDMDDSLTAQDLTVAGGSILRYNSDGTVPDDNPFPDSPVYSYGHRNGFGLAWHPESDVLYESENGMFCDDELNRIRAGRNYGWGSARPDSCPYPDSQGIVPLWEWNPSIAPTGMLFYTGDMLSELNGYLLMCAFHTGHIHRIKLSDNGRQVEDVMELKLGDLGSYCQLDLAQGIDGSLYTATTNLILRILQ
jgi:aldose sugar dehydrogenase